MAISQTARKEEIVFPAVSPFYNPLHIPHPKQVRDLQTVASELTIEQLKEERYTSLKEKFVRDCTDLSLKFKPEDVVNVIKKREETILRKQTEEELSLQRKKRIEFRVIRKFIDSRDWKRALFHTKAFLEYDKKLEDFHQKIEMENYSFFSRQFLNSNLSPETLEMIHSSILWEVGLLRGVPYQIWKTINELKKIKGDMRMFVVTINNYLDAVAQIREITANVSSKRDALYICIDLYNCEFPDEFGEIKRIRTEKIDQTAYQKRAEKLSESTGELRNYFIRTYPQICEKISFVPAPEKKFMTDIISIDILGTKSVD